MANLGMSYPPQMKSRRIRLPVHPDEQTFSVAVDMS